MAEIPRIQTIETTPQATYPNLVLGEEARRDSLNIVHDVVGGGVAISLLEPRTRSGSLRLFYGDRAAAYYAFDLLSRPVTFSFLENYVSPNPSPRDMLFAVDETGVSIERDELTRRRWIVTVGFQELSDS